MLWAKIKKKKKKCRLVENSARIFWDTDDAKRNRFTLGSVHQILHDSVLDPYISEQELGQRSRCEETAESEPRRLLNLPHTAAENTSRDYASLRYPLTGCPHLLAFSGGR